MNELRKNRNFLWMAIVFIGIPLGFMWVANAEARADKTALDFRMASIDGLEIDLNQFKGKIILMVNVASKCGLTPQYEGLQRLYTEYRDRGFTVLGFPANNFAGQEPGTNAEIKFFCTSNYGVTFPMFAKLSVKGEDQHPLYGLLTSRELHPQFGGDIQWNFTKFLIGRNGEILARFEPRTGPEHPEVISAIEQALAIQ
jgi:glutathione peroxidase